MKGILVINTGVAGSTKELVVTNDSFSTGSMAARIIEIGGAEETTRTRNICSGRKMRFRESSSLASTELGKYCFHLRHPWEALEVSVPNKWISGELFALLICCILASPNTSGLSHIINVLHAS